MSRFRKFKRLPLAGTAFMLALAMAGPIQPSQAQAPAPITGTLDASAQGAIAPGAVFAVRASSGSGDARAIADLFRDALESAGYRLEAGQGYVLNFQLSGESPSVGGRSNLELRGNRGSSSSGDVELKMRWKTKRDKTAPSRRGRRLSVAVIGPDRNPVWQADVALHPSNADDFAAVDAVMPALIENLGQTVYALRVP